MLIDGIVNPHVLSLLSRVRHTNSLVIADVAFPNWPQIETVDLSLVRGVPTVVEVLDAILPRWKCGEAFMAKEFLAHNDRRLRNSFVKAFEGVELKFEPHLDLKKRIPAAIGLIRTGDPTLYSNVVLVSA